MNAIEWIAYLAIHGMTGIHEASARLAGVPARTVEPGSVEERERRLARRRELHVLRKASRGRLSSAERVENMMKAIRK